MAYNISPLTAMGGVQAAATIAELVSGERSPHMNWIERLRTAVDFITPDNSLICVANAPFKEDIVTVRPIGMTETFNYHESLPVMMAPEIGSRRKRAVVGSSQGGSINIAKMVCFGESPLDVLVGAAEALGINADFWAEKDWLALMGLNHDKLRSPLGLVVVDATPDGRSYGAYMFEQCVLQNKSRAYQAGDHLVVDNFQLIYEQIVPIWSVSTSEVIDYGTTI